MKTARLLAILAIAAILVMGAGTFVLMGGFPLAKPATPHTAQGIVTAFVIPTHSGTTGQVQVNVLP